jgi:hypothetical protein
MSEEVEQSTRNYEYMLRLGANGEVPEKEIQRRVANYNSSAIDNRVIVLQVQQVMYELGVARILSIYYHAFARQLGKLKRKGLPCYMMENECALLFTRWSARGLSRVVMRDIATRVFNIPLPAEGGTQV